MRADRAMQPAAEEMLARLKNARKALMDAVAGLDEAGFRRRPDPTAWSAAEVLAHLFTTEGIMLERARAALAQSGYVVTPLSDDERDRGRLQAQRMAVPQIVHGLLARRRDTERTLAGLSEQELARTLRHSRWGERTVAWLFERAAEHEAEHAGQIRALRGAQDGGA
jgi:uncharacterized damage-inducible protein DinB